MNSEVLNSRSIQAISRAFTPETINAESGADHYAPFRNVRDRIKERIEITQALG
jgi:hypothetical protein